MKLCQGGSDDCSNGICTSVTESLSASCFNILPGVGVSVTCSPSVLTICLFVFLSILLIVALCKLYCCCRSKNGEAAEAATLIDSATRDPHRERLPLLAARRDTVVPHATELRQLTTKEELALAQLRITRLGAELEEERRGCASAPPAFPTAPALGWATPHAQPEDPRGIDVGEGNLNKSV